MPVTIAEVNKLFADGANVITLSRAEWYAIQQTVKRYAATGLERSQAQREAERVKHISRPVWRSTLAIKQRSRFMGLPPVSSKVYAEALQLPPPGR
jgi:hypothetical protein